MRLGKVLLVAGAGEGLGRSIAKRFAREGYAVALAARNQGRIERLAAETGGLAFAADLASESDVAALFRDVEAGPRPPPTRAFLAGPRAPGPVAALPVHDIAHVWRPRRLPPVLGGGRA